MKTRRHMLFAALPPLAGAFISQTALAHHGMDGQVPNTLFSGLISGLAHPVIGLDHLAFLLAAAVAMASRPNAFRLPWYFILPGLLAAAWHVAGFDLPVSEILVAASLVILGLMLVWRRVDQAMLFLPLLMLAGLLHGYAFGESIVGAESTPLLGYFAGLALVQYGLCAGSILLYRRLVRYWLPGRAEQKAGGQIGWGPAGWAVGAVGGIFLILAVIG